MKSIELRVHPLTRRVLLSEYGAEPLRIGQRDILYSALTTGQSFDRNDLRFANRLLSATITLEVNDVLAEHLRVKWRLIGLHLFRWHKDWMFRYTASMVRSGKSAKGAIREWLDLYDVGEDEYGADTAYKKWQRSGWFFKEKNPVFLNKLLKARGSKKVQKSGYYAKSKYPRKALSLYASEVKIELIAAQAASNLSSQLRRTPKCLHQQIRAYFYKEIAGLTDEQIGEIIGRVRISVCKLRHSLMRRADQNPFIRKVLAEYMAYAVNPA